MNKKDNKNWFVRHYWITTILVFVFIWVFAEMASQPVKPKQTNNYNVTTPKIDTSTPEWFLEKNRGVAKMMCKNAIKEELKTPNSAKFDNEDVRYTWEKWKEAQAAWEVTSQNSFWANITNYYLCNFTWTWKDYILLDSNVLK